MKGKLTGYDRTRAEGDLGEFLDLGGIIDWIAENLRPDQVYDEDELKDWAEHNGYTLAEE